MSKSSLEVRLATEGVHTVVIAGVDMQGRLFGKRVPTKEFLRVCEVGVNISSCALGWDMSQSVGMQVEYTGYHTGWHDLRLVPDLATIRVLAWLDGTALVFADIVDLKTSAEVSISPRAILRRQARAMAESGYFPKVGTELEFFLFSGNYDEVRAGSYRELQPTIAFRSQDLINRATNSLEPYFRSLRKALIDSGLDVAFSETEWGCGQWEINLFHHDPVEMADRQCVLKMASKDIAHTFGLSATFMAKPKVDDVGSSCHVHCSIQDASGRNILYDGSVGGSPAMRHALGGVLEHIPELMLWYAPTVNSYRRTASKQFAGNGRTWGLDNRTTSCRVCGDESDSLRFEFRVPGADANPYLSLAALLAAVKDGLVQHLDPGPRCDGNGYALEGVDALPGTLQEATRLFEESGFTQASFGKDVVRHYAEHARFEVAQFNSAVTDWELSRYFESI